MASAILTGKEIIGVRGVSPTGILSGQEEFATSADVAATKTVTNPVAAAGTSQATATQLTTRINYVTTGSGSALGVILPAAHLGHVIYIFNVGTGQTLTVFGNGTDTVDGQAATTGVSLSNNNRCAFFCVAAGTWVSAQLGAVSS